MRTALNQYYGYFNTMAHGGNRPLDIDAFQVSLNGFFVLFCVVFFFLYARLLGLFLSKLYYVRRHSNLFIF